MRRFILTLALIISCTFLFANGNAEATNEPLEFMIEWDEQNNPTAYKWANDIVAEYNTLHPETTIVLKTVPDPQYNEQLQTLVASGNAPDAFMVRSGEFSRTYAEEGILLPLDDYLAQDGWKETFFPSFLELGNINGNYYSVPGSIRSTYVYYNADMFAKYGLEAPKTFAELENVCETLKANGIVPIALANKEGFEASTVLQAILCGTKKGFEGMAEAVYNGGSYANEDYAYAVSILGDMYKKGWLTQGANGMEFGEALTSFGSEKSAMVIFLNVVPSILQSMGFENFNVGYFNFPKIEDFDELIMNSYPGGAWAISATTEYKDEMASFLKFWTDKVNLAKLCSVTDWIFPVYDSLDPATCVPSQIKYLDDVMNADLVVPFLDSCIPPKHSFAFMAAEQKIFDGMDVVEALKEVDAEAGR